MWPNNVARDEESAGGSISTRTEYSGIRRGLGDPSDQRRESADTVREEELIQ